MSRRTALVVGVAALAIVALVPVGRWERSRQHARNLEAIRALLAPAGPQLRHGLTGTRLAEAFDCLLYGDRHEPFAVEVCFSPDGHALEAIDRRLQTPVFWSFRDDPEAGPAVPVRTLLARFHEGGVLKDVPATAPLLPVGFTDSGASPVPHCVRCAPGSQTRQP